MHMRDETRYSVDHDDDIDDNDEQPLLVEVDEVKHDNRKLVHHLINTSIL